MATVSPGRINEVCGPELGRLPGRATLRWQSSPTQAGPPDRRPAVHACMDEGEDGWNHRGDMKTEEEGMKQRGEDKGEEWER